MSDQVVFTKEEVEKIRNAVYVMQKTFEVLKLDAIKQIPEEVLFLLDSPRPRPKVSRAMYDTLSAWLMGGEYKADEILNQYGFDIED
jgi:hypothetical protein